MTGTCGALADLPEHLGPGLARKHQVQQHQVGAVALELGDGVQPVVGHADLEALLFQQVGQAGR